MPIFEPVHYLILAFGVVILFSYINHYKSPMIYSNSESTFFATVCFGIASAGTGLGLQVLLQKTGLRENVINNALIYSAFLEELVKFLFILLVLWYFKVTEALYHGIFYGVVLGGTFGFVENMIYSSVLAYWPMMLRTITSSTLHLLNGGIAGYFCMKFFFTKENYRYNYLVKGFLLCYFSHAIYNYAGFTGGKYLMLLPPLLVYNFILVEFIGAYAQSTLPKFTLDLIQLSVRDYELIRRYTKYELWLYNEQKQKRKSVSLFQRISFKRIIISALISLFGIGFIILFLLFPKIERAVFHEILKYEYISIFIIYPFMISISVFFAGLINPEFFQRQVLRVPLFSVLEANSKESQETTALFYLTTYGFYAPFLFPEKLKGGITMNFIIGKREFKNIKGRAIWINENKNDPSLIKSKFSVSGALIRFDKYPAFLILYWNWARWINRFNNLKRTMTNSND